METYIILIFLFIMFLSVLQIINISLMVFIILTLKGIIKYKEKVTEDSNRGIGFGK